MQAGGPDIDKLLDYYWGGSERRITGLTVRIIGVNAVALLMLLFGVLFLGEYQNTLITAKLETFREKLELVSTALSQSTGDNATQEKMTRSLSYTMRQRIFLFDAEGLLLVDTAHISGPDGKQRILDFTPPEPQSFQSLEILKSLAGFILNALPNQRKLPAYNEPSSNSAHNFPDVPQALQGERSISAWQKNGTVFLSAAAPIIKNGETAGAILLTRPGRDIEREIGDVWLNIVRVFMVTLIITIFLSIYLSGVIARPLRKLAKAAEDVRLGKAQASDIPDLSDRHDEIGELSLVLRDMTQALWDRMDTIDRFAADVAHELKNPLTSLRSAVETAAIVKDKKDQQKLLDIIKHDVERLDRLITDISSVSRLDAELSRERFERISLRGVLTNLLNIYRDPLERSNAEHFSWDQHVQKDGMSIRLSSPLPGDIYVWGLEGRLMQVLQNLLSNALSFSRPGDTVTIRITLTGRNVHIEVEDEGPGIPPGKTETVFERFYSQRPDHEAYGQHSGLGLSICKQIVNAMGGNIYAENVKGQSGKISGARLVVVLRTVS